MREREKCCQLVQHVLDQMLQIIHDDDSFQSWLALYYLFNRFVGIASDGFDHVASVVDAWRKEQQRDGQGDVEGERDREREKEADYEKLFRRRFNFSPVWKVNCCTRQSMLWYTLGNSI